jgi:hypothetical protein
MSRAAYDLQVLATAHSASCGHPGFVPDDYLEHLDGLSIETTITTAELCTAGMVVDGLVGDRSETFCSLMINQEGSGRSRPA